jgi:hypothetical protein
MPEFEVRVSELREAAEGAPRYLACVVEPGPEGDRLWYLARQPCRTRREALALGQTWINAYRPEDVRRVGDGRWELPGPGERREG